MNNDMENRETALTLTRNTTETNLTPYQPPFAARFSIRTEATIQLVFRLDFVRSVDNSLPRELPRPWR